MNVLRISEEEGNVVVKLTVDDLIFICDELQLHAVSATMKENENSIELYSNMRIARDLCLYGHVDNACLQNVVKCRNTFSTKIDGVLSNEDVDVLNSYLETNDMSTAFGNSDFLRVYKKIVGSYGETHCSEKIRKWIEAKTVGYTET